MARRVNEEDPDDDKLPVSSPVTLRRNFLTSRYFVFGFLTFGVLVLVGSLAFTIVSNTTNTGGTAVPEPKLSFVRRSDWKARPHGGEVPLTTPAQYVIISDTGTEECAKQAQCLAVVYKIQGAHMEEGFLDVTYNFLVGGDGTVYEGRGWGVESATFHIHRRGSFAVGLIGTFTHVVPSKEQLDATQQLIRVGVTYGYINQNYTLMADVDRVTTKLLITGLHNNLLQEISTWPYWSLGS